ncbi:MAG TPA: PilZ domain-containing protein [Pyrinomonadaceae bacterium]|nr:PilZ domain-containing protein [Pyrinomonadaceae bacterium]
MEVDANKDDRRGSPRHKTRREAHLLFIALADDEQHSPALIGYTRDISETGLSLVVTSIHIRDYDLVEVDRKLRIKLSLPAGIVEANAIVIRHEWINEDDPREGHFVGVRITEMGDDDRARYDEYLTTLG